MSPNSLMSSRLAAVRAEIRSFSSVWGALNLSVRDTQGYERGRMYRRAPLQTLSHFVALAALVACGGAPAPAPSQPAKETIHVESDPVATPLGTLSAPATEGDLAIPIRYDDPIRGQRNAYVTLVVFSDFQCPFCAREAETLEQLRIKYGPDSLRIVFKNQPLEFHDRAAYYAEVGVGVMELGGPEAFWTFHNIAFGRARGATSEADALAWAAEVGVNERSLRAGLDSHRWRSKVENDMAIAKSLGVVGTPCTFINGVQVSGAQPLARFVEVIDEELVKARSLAERGVSRDAVYARMLTANLEAKPVAPPREEADEPKPDRTIYKVAVGNAPVRGPATALITIVEFSDFQCPFCSRVSPTLDRIRKEYGDKVRFVWKDGPLPFHSRALPAAMFARSARAQKGNAGFWAAHDKLFATQAHLDDADLEKLAKTLGLNPLVTMTAVRKGAFKAEIDADMAQGKTVKADGTPHFFINGRRFVGAQPFDKFKVVIDEEIVRAEATLKTGVSKAALYDALTKPTP